MTEPGTGELARFGWSPRWAALFADAVDSLELGATPRPGRIVRHDGVAVMVATDEGTEQLPVRGAVEAPAVGDWVVVADDAVAAILPRTSLMRRRDPDKDVEQVLAANVDVVGIVCGLDRPVKHGRIQRTAMLAGDAGAWPLVLLTKADVVGDLDERVAAVRDAHPTLDVLAVDAKGGAGLDAVRTAIAGKTVVLVGESGAGKSTLTNALAGEDLAATAEVRRGDAKGRHTTTAREMHPLPGGAVMVDSPGIRSVGVWVDADTLAEAFSDIEELAEGCRFSDCAHASEPGCAVTAAVADGELAASRLEAFHEMAAEVAAAERRADPQAEKRYGRRFSKVLKEHYSQNPRKE